MVDESHPPSLPPFLLPPFLPAYLQEAAVGGQGKQHHVSQQQVCKAQPPHPGQEERPLGLVGEDIAGAVHVITLDACEGRREGEREGGKKKLVGEDYSITVDV